NAVAAIQHDGFARQGAVPALLSHTCIQHRIEQKGTRSGQGKTAFVASQAPTCEQRPCQLQIAAVTAESLWAEVVGHAVAADALQIGFDRVRWAGYPSQRQIKGIGGMRATTQFARVPALLQDLQPAVSRQGVESLWRRPEHLF